jgi:hypothetical protein
MNRRSLILGLGALPFVARLSAQDGEIHDCYAMALYLDGSLGPRTGIITTEAMLAADPLTYTFWHGHGGVNHAFHISSEQFAELASGRRITLETTVVQNHSHRLFIDPVDPRYRVG